MATFVRRAISSRSSSKTAIGLFASLFAVGCLTYLLLRRPPQALLPQWQPAADGSATPITNPLAEHLPPADIMVARVPVEKPFSYAFLGYDDDSYQVKDKEIRTLEPGLTALWINRTRECCQRGGQVIDVGAHFGYYSLLSASLGCSFVAFEPVPTFASVMHMNLQLNAISGSNHLVNAAVGVKPGEVNMTVPTGGVLGLAHVQTSPEEQPNPSQYTVTVPAVTLDDAVKPSGEVCGIKIDVEGFEPDVVAGGVALLREARVPHIMMEFSPGYRQEGVLEMLGTLHDLGYSGIEIFWDWAKVHSRPLDVDVTVFDAPERRVDFSTPQKRQELVERVLQVTNTNIWFAL